MLAKAGGAKVAAVHHLVVEASERLVLRYLGYPRKRRPAAHIEVALQRMWSIGEALLEPRGVFRLLAGSELSAAEMPDPTELVGVGVCTIGAALERRIQQHAEADEPLEALLLDAFGSAAAEAAADALNQHICQAARKRGYHSRPRVSPGYGRWDVRHQAALLALLPAGKIGITLTEGMMMVPRKSVSFAVGMKPGNAIDDGDDSRTKRKCSRCGLASCPYRVENEEDDEVAVAEASK